MQSVDVWAAGCSSVITSSSSLSASAAADASRCEYERGSRYNQLDARSATMLMNIALAIMSEFNDEFGFLTFLGGSNPTPDQTLQSPVTGSSNCGVKPPSQHPRQIEHWLFHLYIAQHCAAISAAAKLSLLWFRFSSSLVNYTPRVKLVCLHRYRAAVTATPL